jgi:cathepsin L
MEGAFFISKGLLMSLSEQQLINCVNGGQYDCRTGGSIIEAFKYVISSGGIVSEVDEPYKRKDHQKCTFSKSTSLTYTAHFAGYKTVPSNDEDSLKSAAAQQPIAIIIDASHRSFQFYKSGVYDEEQCCTNCQMNELGHAVLLVGYGREGGKDYWIVKNSWNVGWGDKGYVKIIRGDSGRCGVPASPTYPVVYEKNRSSADTIRYQFVIHLIPLTSVLLSLSFS